MKQLDIYIAASWKHQHAVEMLTDLLRQRGHFVRSFVENNNGEHEKKVGQRQISFEEWLKTDQATQSFKYDTDGAGQAQVVIYLGPSGKDAAAECGIAWQAGAILLGLYAKGEDFGLMRKMINWHFNYRELLVTVDAHAGVGEEEKPHKCLVVTCDHPSHRVFRKAKAPYASRHRK